MRSKRLVVSTLTTAFVLLSSAVAKADGAAKQETISVLGQAKLQVPGDFERIEPKSRIIEHEFQIKAGEGDDAAAARITMMAAGGDVDANINRWKEQFTGGDKAAQKTEELKLGKWIVHIVDVSGSFAERMGGGPFAGGKVVNREGYAMTGAILVDPQGRKYFVKMIGPQGIVKANRDAFVKMVKSIEQ